MPNDAPDRFAAVDRVSFRAVLTAPGQDVSEALLKAGILDPAAIPVVLGDGNGVFGEF